jgi:hypothetical protein
MTVVGFIYFGPVLISAFSGRIHGNKMAGIERVTIAVKLYTRIQ